MPTFSEFWAVTNGTFASPLKFPLAGARAGNIASLYNTSNRGYYWISDPGLAVINTIEGQRSLVSTPRGEGFSCRCIKN